MKRERCAACLGHRVRDSEVRNKGRSSMARIRVCVESTKCLSCGGKKF